MTLGSLAEIRCDQDLYIQLSQRFAERENSSELTIEEYQFLKEQFKTRWLSVKDRIGDYTLNNTGANELWYSLAKDLASALNETYVKILFPDVINTVDYHDLTPLTDTAHPENFYLGYCPNESYSVLYRKSSLCDHLQKHQFILSTIQSEKNNTPRALRVEELARLKFSKQTEHKVSIQEAESSNKEEFASFWELLILKVFPKLNPAKTVALDMASYMVYLLQHYFLLKESNAEFTQFKNKYTKFLQFLYSTYNLSFINQFYGIEIGEGTKRYMLDFLIILHKAQNYNIDEELIILAKWLYDYNSLFYINQSQLLANVYSSANSPRERPASVTPDDKVFHECKLMLLSLFVLDMKNLGSNSTISVWDKESRVFSEGAELYRRFAGLLACDDSNEVNRAEIKKGIIARYLEFKAQVMAKEQGSGVLGMLSSWFIPHSDYWYARVKKGTWSESNVFWYEPELLMHTLMHFHAINSWVQDLIWQFLDELIRSYYHEKPYLQKELRVNILFYKLMDKIKGTTEHSVLRLLLDVYAKGCNYKSDFMINSSYYIGNKLRQIDLVQKDAFFPVSADTMKQLKIKISKLNINSMRDLIQQYKNEVMGVEAIKNDPQRCERLMKSLMDLDKRILTCEEEHAAERNIPGVDPLGANT